MYLIETENLSKCYFPKAKKKVYAVNQVSLSIEKGEVLGLVGESGCGKSTLGKLLLQLEKNTSGTVRYGGTDISQYTFRQMQAIRNQLQMVFQNSSNSFNPYYTVRQIILEPLRNYNRISRAEQEEKAAEMLCQVGLDERYLSRYPNELSGGQRQRVGIARALILNPEFVVCDEAVSSLDYAIRNKILDLLAQLRKERGLTYLFISHDLSAVKKICDRVVVMYLGEIVEILPDLNEDKQVRHPYTKALLAATLGVDPRDRRKKRVLFLEGEEEICMEQGCIFQNRCLYAQDLCRKEKPELKSADGKYFVACHLCSEI